MGSITGYLFLFALIFNCGISHARIFTPSHHRVDNSKHSKAVTNLKSKAVCSLCEEFASEALTYISENQDATETEILTYLESACSKADYLESQCLTLVDYYIPLLFTQVESITAEAFCEAVELCTEDSANKIKIKIFEESSVPIDTLKSSVYCTLCQDLSSEALTYFTENENTTETEILTYLESACAKFEYFEDECVKLVDYYVPLLFSQLDTTSAETFCESVKLCSDETSEFILQVENFKHSEEKSVPVETVKGSAFCSVCEEIASEALYYLTENNTETEVLDLLESTCSKLDYFESQCESLVEYYIPLLIEEAESLSADEFCEKIKLCSDDISQIISVIKEAESKKASKKETKMVQTKKTKKTKKSSSKWCSVCEEYATEAISNIGNNANETEVISNLHSACSKLGSLETKCEAMVDYYVPLLFTEAESITPEEFCEQIHFCSSDEKTTIDHLARKVVRKIIIASI